MASGEGVTLDIDPFGMIAIRVDPATYNAQIENSGIIEAEEGTVVMSAPARDALVATVVNNSGTVRAAVMSTHDGEITLEGKTVINTGTLSAATIKATTKNLLDAGSWNAEGGRIEINATGSLVQTAASQMSTDGTEGGELQLTARESIALSGTLTANGTTGRGGRIAITAPQTLLAGAQLQADGRSGGGEILIGGGDGLPAHALTTMMTSPSTLQANALDSGNGGRVVLFSEKSTAFAGTIEAKGGATSGNGGHIELSSEDRLTWTGAVVTTAPNGLAGDILFTARNITVDASAGVPFSLTPLGNLNPIAGETAGGLKILELSNGNILVGSPHDDFVATNSGTLCLYRPDGTLLSMLSGLCANDMVGNNITPLSNSSNAVTATPYWSSDGVAGAGAVTWINGKSGITGVVTAANSLVGALAQDGVGSSVTALTNGNYVVVSPLWDNGATACRPCAVGR